MHRDVAMPGACLLWWDSRQGPLPEAGAALPLPGSRTSCMAPSHHHVPPAVMPVVPGYRILLLRCHARAWACGERDAPCPSAPAQRDLVYPGGRRRRGDSWLGDLPRALFNAVGKWRNSS